MLCLKLLSHGEGDRGLIEGLISSDSHLDFISHSEEQESTLGLVEGHLTDDLVEALAEELLADRADAGLTCLSLHQLLIEKFSQACDINSCGLLVAHILNVVLASLNPFSRRKDSVQDVLGAGL